MKALDIVGSLAVGFAVGSVGSAKYCDPDKAFPAVQETVKKADKCINTVANAYPQCVNEATN